MEPIATTTADTEQRGLQGWLALFSFGVVLTPFYLLGTFLSELDGVLKQEHVTWAQYVGFMFTWPAHAVFGIWLIQWGIIALVASIIAWTVVNIRLLFRHDARFVPSWLGFLGTILVLDLILLLTGNLDAGDGVRDFVIAAVWGPYLLTSQRVKNTFVRRGGVAEFLNETGGHKEGR